MFNLFFLLGALVTSVYGQTGCSTDICVFSNNNLRFGTGAQNSINNNGLFVQPWYYSYTSNSWYKLTYAGYPLDTAIGSGTGSSHWSGSNIVDLYSLTPSNIQNDYTNFIVSYQDSVKTVGYGKIVVSRSYTLNNNNIVFQNTFSLGRNDSFVKVNTRIINNSTNTINNLFIWVGTRDDYVGITDVNTKTRGNLINGSFVAITQNNQSSYAIMITNTNEGVLFYSETPGVMTSYALCCSFSNVYNTNPINLSPFTPSPTDGSYSVVLPLGNIPVSSSGNIIWYYAAGSISSLGSVSQSVADAQVADVIAPISSINATISKTVSSSGSFLDSPSYIDTYSLFVSPSNNPSFLNTYSSYVSPSSSPSFFDTYSSYMSRSSNPSNCFSPSSTPSSYETISALMTETSTLSSTKSLIIQDKVQILQLSSDIVSNFIIINVVTIFVIFGLICILLCCVYGMVLYKKKNYCDECKYGIPIKTPQLKLAFVNSEDEVTITSVEENTKIPNSIN